MNIIAVDINGTPHEIEATAKPDFHVFAKLSGSRYLVLASAAGNLFNPLDASEHVFTRDRERGGLLWRLKTCSEECYQQYTIFLRSKNKTPFLLAQRRFRNDFR